MNHPISLFKVVVMTCITAALITGVSTEVYTSSEKVKDLLSGEETMLSVLQQYINIQYSKLKTLSEFQQHRLQLLHNRTLTEKKPNIDHPNSFYTVIKQFARSYEHALDQHFGSFQSHLTNNWKGLYLADGGDLKGAKQALIRLQSVYKLRALDMAKGNYLGFEGPSLDLSDIYEIGQIAFTEGHLNASIDWLETAAKLAMKKILDGEESFEPSLGTILGLQGRVHIWNGDIKTAAQLYQRAYAIDPQNSEIITLKEELVTQPRPNLPPPRDYVQNYSRLCSMEEKLYTPLRHQPRIVCRYQTGLQPYYRFKEEILSESPFVSVIYDVITDKENEFLRSHVKRQLQRGHIGQNLGIGGVQSEIRTSDTAWVLDEESPLAKSMSLRIQQITGLSTQQQHHNIGPSSGEAFQVVNYGLGGHYEVHTDPHLHPAEVPYLKNSGFRVATFMVYLTNVEKGGNTVFTRADMSVAPVKNMALFWYNFTPAGALPDQQTHHAGCPVLVGHKWVTNKWIWTYGNTFRRRCGLNPEATQLDIEKDIQTHYGAR